MKIEEYIDKNIILEGYGHGSVFALHAAFFEEQEFIHGRIKDVDIFSGEPKRK